MKKFLVLILCILLQNVYGATRAAAAEDRREVRAPLLQSGEVNPFRAAAEDAPAGGAGVAAAEVRVPVVPGPGDMPADPAALRDLAAARRERANLDLADADRLLTEAEIQTANLTYTAAMAAARTPTGGFSPDAVTSLMLAAKQGSGLASAALGNHKVSAGDVALAAAGRGFCSRFFGCICRSHRFCCGSRCARSALPWIVSYREALDHYRIAQQRLTLLMSNRHLEDQLQANSRQQLGALDVAITNLKSRYYYRCCGSLPAGIASSIGVYVGDLALIAFGLLIWELSPQFQKQA